MAPQDDGSGVKKLGEPKARDGLGVYVTSAALFRTVVAIAMDRDVDRRPREHGLRGGGGDQRELVTTIAVLLTNV